MKALKHWLLVVCLVLGPPLLAKDDANDKVAPDVPVQIEKDLFHAPLRLTAATGIIDSGPALGHSGPWVEDVDGDGAKDLVVGDFSGFFRLYRNEGTNQQPRYAKAVNLQAGGVDAQVPIS